MTEDLDKFLAGLEEMNKKCRPGSYLLEEYKHKAFDAIPKLIAIVKGMKWVMTNICLEVHPSIVIDVLSQANEIAKDK